MKKMLVTIFCIHLTLSSCSQSDNSASLNAEDNSTQGKRELTPSDSTENKTNRELIKENVDKHKNTNAGINEQSKNLTEINQTENRLSDTTSEISRKSNLAASTKPKELRNSDVMPEFTKDERVQKIQDLNEELKLFKGKPLTDLERKRVVELAIEMKKLSQEMRDESNKQITDHMNKSTKTLN